MALTGLSVRISGTVVGTGSLICCIWIYVLWMMDNYFVTIYPKLHELCMSWIGYDMMFVYMYLIYYLYY